MWRLYVSVPPMTVELYDTVSRGRVAGPMYHPLTRVQRGYRMFQYPPEVWSCMIQYQETGWPVLRMALWPRALTWRLYVLPLEVGVKISFKILLEYIKSKFV